MDTKTINRITFTKLFAQRSGASFAQVLHQCFATTALLEAFNRIHKTSLALDETSGVVVARDVKADLDREIDSFATFAWQDVFLQIQRAPVA